MSMIQEYIIENEYFQSGEFHVAIKKQIINT